MDAKRWLNELRAELARRKLPPLYVERLVLELSDHFSDCMEDRMSTDAKDLHGVFQRLGSPAQVATSASQEFRKARFARRHPVLMFVLLPVLSLPLLWFATVATVLLTCKLLGLETGKVVTTSSIWQAANAALPYLVVALLVVPASLAAAFFCRAAAKANVDWKWSLAASLLLAVIGGAAMMQFTLPTEMAHGSFSFGLRLGLQPTVSQVLQFLVPFCIGGWAVWRQLRNGATQSQPA